MPDFPGFGDAAGEPWVSLDQTTGEVAELVRTRAAGGRAHVVVVSLGGIVAINASSPRRRELIEHAVGRRRQRACRFAISPWPKLGLQLMRPIVDRSR